MLIGICAVVLVVTYLPTGLALRLLGADRLLALALAPPLAAALAGLAAIVAGAAGVRWGLPVYALAALVMLGAAGLLARCGMRLPGAGDRDGDGDGRSGRGGRWSRHSLRETWWVPTSLLLALVIALGPILAALRTGSGILERWDTLYHLSALARIRDLGDASSRTLGIISNTVGEPVFYPAAFHGLASLVPIGTVPEVLTASTLVLAVVPWTIGIALLARLLWPSVRWAAPAAALGAVLVPAAPVDEWIHLSAIPNLTAMSMLPGALAGLLVLWRSVLARHDSPGVPATAEPVAKEPRAVPATRRGLVVIVLVLLGVLLGLALLQPNTAVALLILVAVLTTVTGASRWRTAPLLAAVPVLAMVPLGVLTWTPLGAGVTNFEGGLQVPLWTALGEVLLGLLTVWPMALGVVMALVWWPGLIRTMRSPQRWVAIAWIVIAVLYLDAAVDSPLDLSVLFYRGQDRLAMPLAMLSVLLMVPGLQLLLHLVRSSPARRPVSAALVVLALVAAGTSIPTRSDNAQKNLAWEYEGRGRFLQQDEVEAFERAAPQMDDGAVLLASPFSGAAHMAVVHGMTVRFPVAGMSFKGTDQELVDAVPEAATSAEACATLRRAHVGYVYQERTPYQWDPRYGPIEQADDSLGEVVFQTSHSRLIEVDCEDGESG